MIGRRASNCTVAQFQICRNIERDAEHLNLLAANDVMQIERMMHRELAGNLWYPFVDALRLLTSIGNMNFNLDIKMVGLWVLEYLPIFAHIQNHPQWQAVWDRILSDDVNQSYFTAKMV